MKAVWNLFLKDESRWKFCSCHSFGVVVALRGYGMCQMFGASEAQIYLKMRRVGQCVYQLSHVLIFSVQVVPKPFTCPRKKSLLVECHSLDDQIVRGPIITNNRISTLLIHQFYPSRFGCPHLTRKLIIIQLFSYSPV